jgi:PKD repeat protein
MSTPTGPNYQYVVQPDGLTVVFTDESTTNTPPILGWQWDFGDGNTSTVQNPTHTYAGAENYTVNLTISSYGEPVTTNQTINVPGPTYGASFTYAAEPNGLTIDFTDTSTTNDPPIQYRQWDFGDGSPINGQTNPSYTYQNPGTYTVTLTVNTYNGNEVTSQSIVVVDTEASPATFTYTTNGLQVTVTDTSVSANPPIVGWSWDFGDGTVVNGQNPGPHVYAAAGTYTIALTITDYAGVQPSGSQAVPVTAIVAGPNPQASFTVAVLSGETVQFTDSSTDANGTIATWHWDFGDGNTSASPSPIHTYTVPGSYHATLTITDSGSGAVSNSSSQTVNVPLATASFNESSNGLTASFVSTSVTSTAYTITNYYWNFGDGNTSTLANPTHTYGAAGSYTVSLAVQDTSGSTKSPVISKQVTVAAAPPQVVPPVANFAAVVNNLSVSFTDASTDTASTIVSRLWSFGDGVTSTLANPSHSYSTSGTYSVTLTVTDGNGQTATKTTAVLTTTGAVGGAADPNAPTYTFKGFASFGALANNTPNVIAALGELSVYSATFSKDRLLFGSSTGGSTPSSLNLTVFSSVNADGSTATPPGDYVSSIETIVSWMYNQSLAGQFTADVNVFLQAIQAQYSNTIQSVTCDAMVTQNGIWLPGQVQFFFQNPSAISPTNTGSSRIKLWFADAVFRNEYDLFSYAFVPPIANLDDFFKTAAAVQAEVNARTTPQLAAAIQLAQNHQPYTIVEASTFNWIDPQNATNFIPTAWTYLIWGAAGNNIDAIKSALQAYILANSTHSHDEWAAIFPDIFTSTEFIITPLWTQYAVPNKTLDPGVYSPTVNPNQALLMAQETAVGAGYNDEFVANVINIVPTSYKAMSLLVVGGPQNQGGIYEFAKRWPDYIDVSTTSTDFDRMSEDTQGFVSMLQTLLLAAENMTESSDIPQDITRLHRTNANGDIILYAVGSYDEVEYLCVAKSWLISKYGASTNTVGSIGISYDGTYNNGAYQLLSSTPQMQLQFVAENAVVPNSFEIVDSTITGVSIDQNSGLFTGSFPAPGLYSLTLKLTDAQAHAVQDTFQFNFQAPSTGSSGSQALGISSVSMPDGLVGNAYAGTALIIGGTGPYIVLAEQLPAGLSASISNSELSVSGAPVSAVTNFVANITVADSSSPTPATANTVFDINISAGT